MENRLFIRGGMRLLGWRVENMEFVCSFVVECGCWEWEKMIDRNKINFFYLLYINDIMGNGPWASGGPGQVPLLPWPRAGPAHEPQSMFANCEL